MAGDKRFLLRLDPELYEALARWAADDFRSVNAQIEYLLREAVRKAGRETTRPRGRGGQAARVADPRRGKGHPMI